MKLKFKHVFIIYLTGFFLTGIGALFKIQSWMYASEALTLGYVIYGLAVVLLIVKLVFFKDKDSILNK